MVRLTAQSDLGEILSLYPQTATVLRKFGIQTSG